MLWADIHRAGIDDRAFPDPVERTATVVDTDPETELVDLTWPDPAGGPPVRAATRVHDAEALPVRGDTVAVETSAGDPAAARLLTDRDSALHGLPLYTGLVLLPLAFAATRWWHLHRLHELAASPAISYAMLAALAPPERWRRRWHLLLYPLDAAPGARPVCAVALVTAPAVASGHLRIEVKGAPRPHGRLAVRAGEEVLWPRGRALGRLPRHAWGLPAAPGELVTGLPATPSPTAGRPGSPWPAWRLRTAGLALLAAYIVLYGMGRVEAEQVLEASRPGRAVAVAAGDRRDKPGWYPADLAIDGTTVRALVDGRGGRPDPGTTVEVRYLVADPQVAWARGTTFPPGTGGLLDALVLLAAVPLLVASGRRAEQARAAAAADQYLRYGRVAVGFPPAGWKGLGVRNGRLWFPASSAGVQAGPATPGATVRFEAEGLVLVEGGAGGPLLGWEGWHPAGDTQLPPEGLLSPSWTLRPHPSGSRRYELDIAGRDHPVRIRQGGRAADLVAALIVRAGTDPAGRDGLGDPRRTAALVAVLVRDGPRRAADVLVRTRGADGTIS